MKSYEQLINNVIGQLNGIKKMMEKEDKDCFKTLTQMKAAKSAMGSVMNKFVKENFIECMGKCKSSEEREAECEKYLKEIF